MDPLHALLKAVVQGITEFLPVSSTAHLIFSDALFHLPPQDYEFYDILLHIGTVIAVAVYFRKELAAIYRELVHRPDANAPKPEPEIDLLRRTSAKQLVMLLGISLFVTCVFALGVLKLSEVVMAANGWQSPGVEDISDWYLANPQWVCIHLFATGVLLFVLDRSRPPANPGDVAPVTPKEATTIGLFQGFAAIFHGLSRSGSTIAGGLASGLDRVTATRYAFLLSIPTFLMAIAYQVLKLIKAPPGTTEVIDWPVMLGGMLVSAIVGYFVVGWFLNFVARYSLRWFSLYCWVISVTMWFWLR